jgi:hypothetical protein
MPCGAFGEVDVGTRVASGVLTVPTTQLNVGNRWMRSDSMSFRVRIFGQGRYVPGGRPWLDAQR